MTVEPKIAAAIDFGTHASGFAWAVMSRLNDDPLTREVTFRTGHAGAGDGYHKELTAILVDRDGQVLAWGHAARARWAVAADAGNPDQLGYAYAFKRAIRDGDAGPGMPTVGGSMSLADRGQVRRAVAGYLREIRKAALADITAAGYPGAEIRWCITIPALWDERERDAVRQAACEAGFPDDDERLLLSAEPEAAALRCRLGLDPGGARFLVVDCGGGAVGITAYQASARTTGHACPREGGTLDEIGVAVGGRPGSQFIDHAFRVTVLAQRFGAGAMRRLERANAAGLLQLLRAWEQARATAGVEGGRDGTVRFTAPVVIAIPPAVWEDLDEAARGRLTEQANGEPRRLVLDPELVKALFDTVTTGIVASVAEQLGNIRRACGPDAEPEAIVVVGGLAASAYVQEALRRRFGGEYRVLVPAAPALAVLEGAVHYAYDPGTLASRRSRYTYGFALAMPWEAGADSAMRKFRGKDQAMLCRDRFAVAVRRRDRVAVDEPFPFVVEPAFPESSEVTVQLFKTSAADPRYVDDEGCELVGELTVDVSETAGQAERPLALLLYFGRSQIQVEAIDLTTSRKFRAAIEFERTSLRREPRRHGHARDARACREGDHRPDQRGGVIRAAGPGREGRRARGDGFLTGRGMAGPAGRPAGTLPCRG